MSACGTDNRRYFSDRVIGGEEMLIRTATKLFEWEHGRAGERVHVRRLGCEMVSQLMGETLRQFCHPTPTCMK